MQYYHSFWEYLNNEGKKILSLTFNTSEETAKLPCTRYMEGKPLFLDGQFIPSSHIKSVHIFTSHKKINELIVPTKKEFLDMPNEKLLERCNHGIEGLYHCTGKFITEAPPQKAQQDIKIDSIKASQKNKVFIVHGRNEIPALKLQKFLKTKLKIDAEMFEDLKQKIGSKTIIELLEYIQNNACYAFVIVTKDDYGCLCEEVDNYKNKLMIGKEKINVSEVCEMFQYFKKRPRQNVVFEFGLFIGSLGRNNVCCLMEKGTQEKPSDIDGILYVGFHKSVREAFPEILEKMKDVDLVQV